MTSPHMRTEHEYKRIIIWHNDSVNVYTITRELAKATSTGLEEGEKLVVARAPIPPSCVPRRALSLPTRRSTHTTSTRIQ